MNSTTADPWWTRSLGLRIIPDESVASTEPGQVWVEPIFRAKVPADEWGHGAAGKTLRAGDLLSPDHSDVGRNAAGQFAGLCACASFNKYSGRWHAYYSYEAVTGMRLPYAKDILRTLTELRRALTIRAPDGTDFETTDAAEVVSALMRVMRVDFLAFYPTQPRTSNYPCKRRTQGSSAVPEGTPEITKASRARPRFEQLLGDIWTPRATAEAAGPGREA